MPKDIILAYLAEKQDFSKTCLEDTVLRPETMHLFFSMIICKMTQADFIPADFGSDENQDYN